MFIFLGIIWVILTVTNVEMCLKKYSENITGKILKKALNGRQNNNELYIPKFEYLNNASFTRALSTRRQFY